MEGVNMGGILLAYLGLLVFGCAALVAFGFLAARKIRVARLVFASGMLLSALILAIATLSFFQREFHGGEIWPTILLGTLVLLLSGIGPFIAAIRNPRAYGASLACVGLVVVLSVIMTGGEAMAAILSVRDLSPLALRFIPALILFLAIASLTIALFPPQRRGEVAWTTQALLGAIAGFLAGDAAIATHCTLLAQAGIATPVRVEVFVLGVRVSEATGMAEVADAGPSAIRSLSVTQAAWVDGVPAVAAVAGIIVALGIAAWLIGRPREEIHADPATIADRPREQRSSSDQIKPA